MEATLRKAAIKISKESAFVLLTVACAVALPQIFHGLGVLLGVGGKLGQIFLPMYIPVIILGFYRGPVAGAVTGLLAPLVSFAITGMPTEALLPFITVELIATGLLAGVICNVKMHATLRILSVQTGAKAVRLLAFLIVSLIKTGTVVASQLFAGILTSIPGIVLQLILITYLLMNKEKGNE